MDELTYVYGTAALILVYLAIDVGRRTFDPFAPVWLFLTGYVQVYVVQAISYHDWAIDARGVEVVSAANARSFWALCWFLLVYQVPAGRWFASKWPKAPAAWSAGPIAVMAPVLVVWGLAGAFLVSYDQTKQGAEVSAEAFLFLQFPFMTQVGAILLIVTGRSPARPRPAYAAIGMALAIFYVFLWMYNGKRSHSLIGVLTTICAWYGTRGRRPSFAMLGITALLGVVAVTLAIGWRNNPKYERSVSGFVQYLGDFNPAMILANLNVADREDDAPPSRRRVVSYETEEYGGYLLMLDTVPFKSPYDYGSSYLRLFSTFIPRIFWPNKPFYGREEWVGAWIAGSEFKRDATFTGPAIGILGATQLNGGATATAIVLGVLALLIRSGYEYFRRYADRPWAQAWWALTFFNAWFMTVNDDPFVWFYYLYGFTTLPPLAFLWIYNRLNASGGDARALPAQFGRWGRAVAAP